MSSLIFCSAGIPLHYHKDYDRNNHWRKTDGIQRDYETVVYQYKDFDIESNSYDKLFKGTGYKWQVAKQFLDSFDYSKYEYIGFFDDDLVTDIQSVNRALSIAREKNIKLFQMSLNYDSERQHFITFQDQNKKYSITNFVEGMGPFIHHSVMPAFVDFWNYHEIKSGWGFDLVLSSILKVDAGIIHEVSMHHVPKHNPYYDKSDAFVEMDDILNVVYPKFMKGRYNEDVGPYTDRQKILKFTMNNI
jgi:hypothetical protein